MNWAHRGCAGNWAPSPAESHCSTHPSHGPLWWPSLKALVADLVVAQVDTCDRLVGTEGVGEGLGIKKLRRFCGAKVACACHRRFAVVRCSGGRAFTPSLPKLLLWRSTCLTVWLIRKASARACGVGQVQNTGSSAYQDFHARPLISDPHLTIQPSLFYMFDHIWIVTCFCRGSAVHPKVTHCNTFST